MWLQANDDWNNWTLMFYMYTDDELFIETINLFLLQKVVIA